MNEHEIDWFKKIKPEYIILSSSSKKILEEKYEMDFAEIQEKMQKGELEVEDKYKLILLDGLKDVARQHGYKSITYPHTFISEDGSYVEKVCRIEWGWGEKSCPSYCIFEDSADAHKNNTFSWYGDYLSTAATNRAFARCVRNFLGISILGADEIGSSKEDSNVNSVVESTPLQLHALLKEMAKIKGYNFESIKSEMIKSKQQKIDKAKKQIQEVTKSKIYSEEEKKNYVESFQHEINSANEEMPENYESFEDIPKNKAYAILGWLKKKEDKVE